MKVYIAIHGEKCEGYSIVSVHATKEAATKAAKKMRTCFSGGWQLQEDGSYENGCDFINVEEHEVEE
jgi:hypothetical protein